MTILVTGSAGFIGFHLSKFLLEKGYNVVGIDNLNSYYDVSLKKGRLKELGIYITGKKKEKYKSSKYSNFNFYYSDISNNVSIKNIFEIYKFDKVCHLAAQAGVRYSLEKPEKYINSNIIGFFNILNCIKSYSIKHFIYASSSSVYGKSEIFPLSERLNVDKPISLYAATKKSNELFAYSYSHLYGIQTTGLRFFTVYGPWGRPDMSYYIFVKNILNNKSIKVFNNGNMFRDFTYIDDIIDGIYKIIKSKEKKENYNIYNIGNNKSENLLSFIETIEKNLGRKAKKEYLETQPGDVIKTYANIDKVIKDFNFNPKTSIDIGLKKFIKWYKLYFK